MPVRNEETQGVTKPVAAATIGRDEKSRSQNWQVHGQEHSAQSHQVKQDWDDNPKGCEKRSHQNFAHQFDLLFGIHFTDHSLALSF